MLEEIQKAVAALPANFSINVRVNSAGTTVSLEYRKHRLLPETQLQYIRIEPENLGQCVEYLTQFAKSTVAIDNPSGSTTLLQIEHEPAPMSEPTDYNKELLSWEQRFNDDIKRVLSGESL